MHTLTRIPRMFPAVAAREVVTPVPRNGSAETGSMCRADRLGPRSTLPFAEEGHASATPLGKRGEHVLWYLENFGGAPVAEAVRHPRESKKTLAAQANAWLGTISPGAELRIAVVPEADCAVGTYRFSLPADVPSRPFRAGNVGFGMTYALSPIVALLAPKRDLARSVDHLVIIENPEAHLHPGGQTSLAELSARAAAGGSQIILETHSDHVLDGVASRGAGKVSFPPIKSSFTILSERGSTCE